MKDGFITALGTPFDEMGNLIEESLYKHVEDQVNAGAAGILVMGTMGIEPYIRNSEYIKAAVVAVKAAKRRCSVFIGVMDNSAGRVLDRIESLGKLDIDGVVTTTPYYNVFNQNEIISFFKMIAGNSKYPVYIYDLPGVTKIRLSTSTIEEIMKEDNVHGIKTAEIVTARELLRSPKLKAGFTIMFSGSDTFDMAYKYGFRKILDGMFACTPALTSKMCLSLENGDFEQAAKYMDKILTLRNVFLEIGVFKGFTHAMNILGYKGIFSPDFAFKHSDEEYERVKNCMETYGIS